MPMIYIHGWNAPTKVFATVPLVNANALLDMRVLHVNELFVLTTAMIAEPVGLRSTWPAKPDALMMLCGIPLNMLVAIAMQAIEVLLATCKNALLAKIL